jgi:hypothetical protein
MSGVHRDTIMRLGVRVGEGCQRIMDEKMRNLNCRRIQVDEVWGFVGMKQKTAFNRRRKRGVGMFGRGLLLIPKRNLCRLSQSATAQATWRTVLRKI